MPIASLENYLYRFIRILIKGSSLFLGLILAVVAIWAFQLGIDNNSTFGSKRLALLLLGIIFILWAAWDWIGPSLSTVITGTWRKFIETSLIRAVKIRFVEVRDQLKESDWILKTGQTINDIRQSTLISWMSRHWLRLSLGGVSILTVVVYLWIFSAGRMILPTSGTRYYSWLADAFHDRQVHLLIKPSPGLMDLADPYDHHQRSDVNYIWDASLYDGNYYLYWGPVPGVVALSLQVLSSGIVRDSLLTFGFVCGAFAFSALLLSAIWHRFSNVFPRWGYLGGLLAVALNVPMVWLLTRPAVYEASIAGGQFFLMAGLYWSFLAVSKAKLSKGFLGLAGVSWALTAGTRVNLVPAIILLSFMVLWRVYQSQSRKLRSALIPGLAFLLPLLIGAILLAGYNYARFNSIFEFGHRYQLTGPAYPASYDRVTTLAYSLPNLFNYLIRLPDFGGEFPFVTIPYVKWWPFFIQLPRDYYSAEPVAGLLWLVPITGIALIVFIRFVWLKVNQSTPERLSILGDDDRSLLGWLSVTLAGVGGLQLGLLLVFISSSLRYLADITLIAILLATIFIVQIRASFQLSKFRRGLLATLWLTSSGLTALFGIIVNISGYAHGFEKNNPALYDYLLTLFQ